MGYHSHGRKNRNSGVYVKGSTSNEFEVDYDGKLEEVIELQYHSEQNKVFYSNTIDMTQLTKESK